MSPSTGQICNLAMHEGRALYSAAEAMLKGMLEADREVALVTGPQRRDLTEPWDISHGWSDAFGELLATARRDDVGDLMRQHGTTILPTQSVRRSLTIALRQAKAGNCVFAFVPNDQLHTALDELAQAASLSFGGSSHASSATERTSAEAGALCLILEDHPRVNPAVCPRQIALGLGLPCIEAESVLQLRDCMDQALRLSRAGACAVAVVAHHSLLRASETMEARPNRVASPIEMPLLKRRRRPRLAESGGVLRMARRMELNRIHALPSPGERVAVGFITVGPAGAALQHLTHVLKMHGRVPVLHLGLLGPIDETLLERFLTRCEKAVVLEARPGMMQVFLLATVELLRQRGVSTATLWGRLVPPIGDEAAASLLFDEATHLSTLARRIVHLLHPLRPALQVGAKLTSPPPPLPHPSPPRGMSIGPSAAHAALRRVLADVDQRLRMQGAAEEPVRAVTLAIDGAALQGSAERVVPVEIWSNQAFREFGDAALRQAVTTGLAGSTFGATADGSVAGAFVFAVLDLDGASGELERLARAYVPSKFAEHVSIITTDLNERMEVRDRLIEAAGADHGSVIIIRDGPPSRFSLAGIKRQLADTDRLGFEPRQWLIRPADEVCAIRDGAVGAADEPLTDSVDADERASDILARLTGSNKASADEEEPPRQTSGPRELDHIMRTTYLVEKISKRQSSRMRVKVQPLLEQIEVIRTRPPAWVWRSEMRRQPDLPAPLHAKRSAWRIHLAGWRGDAPGIATRVLCEAGRVMGYDVGAAYDDTDVAAGCRAWAQVLFSRSASEAGTQLSTRIPYGDADVLLGLEWQETLRSIDPAEPLRVAHCDRTGAVVNHGAFQADVCGGPSAAQREALLESVRCVTQDEHCLVHDYASACRTWFFTDRVTDLAILGAAFQQGLIPVRLDAIETALQRVEGAGGASASGGYGRSLEAFQFGRYLAVDDRLLPGGRRVRGDVADEEELSRVTRRMVLSVRSTRWGGRARARKFQRLIEQCLVSMPGLGETAPGRQAQRDMVAALYRCMEWGGMEYAELYGRLLMDLYRVDRGDKGRAITRGAVLPLAEAMLIRDQVFIASMAASPEQRRRLRAAGTLGMPGSGLNVMPARGDRLERRYLTRLELIAFNHLFRLDIRTSDWPARMAKASRVVLPQRWRGSRRDRELRQYMIDFVHRAMHGCCRDADSYDAWAEAMQRLHHHAVEQRLRTMAMSEVRMLAEPAGNERSEPDAHAAAGSVIAGR